MLTWQAFSPWPADRLEEIGGEGGRACLLPRQPRMLHCRPRQPGWPATARDCTAASFLAGGRRAYTFVADEAGAGQQGGGEDRQAAEQRGRERLARALEAFQGYDQRLRGEEGRVERAAAGHGSEQAATAVVGVPERAART